jgi:hypothetical protein
MPRTMNEKPKVEGRRARLREDPELEATEGTTRRWQRRRPRKRSDEGGEDDDDEGNDGRRSTSRAARIDVERRLESDERDTPLP